MDAVGDDVQIMWDRDIFEPAGRSYEYTEIVLFTQRTNSACGAASAGVGPFYCPADRLVYLEETFFRELARRFGAPGDFARAYVLAHEFGHHVQTLLGIEGDVRRQQRANPDDANELSVRLELQADCFAGVWANSVYDREAVNDADIEEGLNAAAAVGDDRLQQQTSGSCEPGHVHARHVRAAHDVVPSRLRIGRSRGLRHVQRRRLMGLLRSWYERAYRRGDSSRWDTGITPPELLALLETLEPGTALDLGCGTGTNAIELASRGWFVTGVDFSSLAIDNARRKAGWVSGVTFVEGDVSEPACARRGRAVRPGRRHRVLPQRRGVRGGTPTFARSRA